MPTKTLLWAFWEKFLHLHPGGWCNQLYRHLLPEQEDPLKNSRPQHIIGIWILHFSVQTGSDWFIWSEGQATINENQSKTFTVAPSHFVMVQEIVSDQRVLRSSSKTTSTSKRASRSCSESSTRNTARASKTRSRSLGKWLDSSMELFHTSSNLIPGQSLPRNDTWEFLI